MNPQITKVSDTEVAIPVDPTIASLSDLKAKLAQAQSRLDRYDQEMADRATERQPLVDAVAKAQDLINQANALGIKDVTPADVSADNPIAP